MRIAVLIRRRDGRRRNRRADAPAAATAHTPLQRGRSAHRTGSRNAGSIAGPRTATTASCLGASPCSPAYSWRRFVENPRSSPVTYWAARPRARRARGDTGGDDQRGREAGAGGRDRLGFNGHTWAARSRGSGSRAAATDFRRGPRPTPAAFDLRASSACLPLVFPVSGNRTHDGAGSASAGVLPLREEGGGRPRRNGSRLRSGPRRPSDAETSPGEAPLYGRQAGGSADRSGSG
jgi:hypothetical protein